MYLMEVDLQLAEEEGLVSEATGSLGRPLYLGGTPLRRDLQNLKAREGQADVVHVNRLWRYHGQGNYT